MGSPLQDKALRCLQAIAPSRGTCKMLGTYWAVAAVTVFWLAGRFSSPNKRFKKLELSSLSDEEPSPPRPSQVKERPERKLVKKLSFLKDTEEKGPNPFINETWEVTKLERIKYAVLGPVLLPVRVLAILVLLVLGSGYAKLVCVGADLSRPMPRWRVVAQAPLRWVARGLLLSMGYYWINVKGRPASSREAPIQVANHISFVDGIIMPAASLSMAISRAENASVPFFGAVMKAMQCIFVSRTDKDSRATVSREMEKRAKAERGQWGRTLFLFPEGTTTNGTTIISFKAGAFAPGVPVQPVAIRYPSRTTFDNSWVTGGPAPHELLLRLLMQPWNRMEIRYLPVYSPSAQEKADPSFYARNVRNAIARDLGIQSTEHCFDDVLLLIEARKLGYRGSLRQCVVETKALRHVLEVDLEKAKHYLQTFARLDTERKGELTYPEFVRVFSNKDTPELQKLFDLLDTGDRGSIRFKEFLTGLAILNEQGTDGFLGSVKLAFRTFDTSGEERLSREDVQRVLGRWLALNQEQIDKAFDDADLDKDGKISPEEFVHFAQAHRELWPKLRQAIF